MFISKIHIENFRSFVDIEVELHEGINVITGYNNLIVENLTCL